MGESKPAGARRTCDRPGGLPECRMEGRAMPLHDWTDERGWCSLHPLWLVYLVEWIQPRLPEGYRAFVGRVPALTVATTNCKPDVSVRQMESRPVAEVKTTDTAVMK